MIAETAISSYLTLLIVLRLAVTGQTSNTKFKTEINDAKIGSDLPRQKEAVGIRSHVHDVLNDFGEIISRSFVYDERLLRVITLENAPARLYRVV